MADSRRPSSTRGRSASAPTASSGKPPEKTWDATRFNRELTHKRVLQLVKWLEGLDLPGEPFQLNSMSRVTDPAKFLAALRSEVAKGPKGPRAYYGAIQMDLLNLWNHCKSKETP